MTDQYKRLLAEYYASTKDATEEGANNYATAMTRILTIKIK